MKETDIGIIPIGSFGQAIKILGIEDYGPRIFNSNSRGELFHLEQYVRLAELLKDTQKEDPTFFRKWFEEIVIKTGEKWGRPESVFQHVSTFFEQTVQHLRDFV